LLLPNLDVTFTEQSGYNLATIRPTIQLIIAIKQGLSDFKAKIVQLKSDEHIPVTKSISPFSNEGQ
jgi:hypothetical protein